MTFVTVCCTNELSCEAVSLIKETFVKDKQDWDFRGLSGKYSREELLQAVSDVDALMVRSDKLDETVLNAAKKLRVVVRCGAGVDTIDLGTATKNGVCVENTPGQNANAGPTSA